MQGVTKIYKVKRNEKLLDHSYKKINALDDLNLTINDGECVGIIGLNGSGKSTLMKIIIGILKIDEGDISVMGNDPFKYRKDNAFHIGIVFGQRSQLRWDLSAKNSFDLLKTIYSIDDEIYQQRLENFDQYLHIKDFIDQPIRTLSLGQRMKAEIVGSILHDPKLIVFDEPTIGLDAVSRIEILNLLRNIISDKTHTVIYTSHFLNEVVELCGRILILNKGKLVEDMAAEDIDKLKNDKKIEIESFHNVTIDYCDYTVLQKDTYSYEINHVKPEDIGFLYQNIYQRNDGILSVEIKSYTVEDLIAKMQGEAIIDD